MKSRKEETNIRINKAHTGVCGVCLGVSMRLIDAECTFTLFFCHYFLPREHAWSGIERRIIYLLFFLERRSSRVVVRGMNSVVSMLIKNMNNKIITIKYNA